LASTKKTDAQLVEEHIDGDFDRYAGGRADARLRESGVSVWAIVSFLKVYSGNVTKVAEHFDLTREEVEGALAYYRLNKSFIDARVALNEA
jgi:uncharacterized protein (DUF433 family)